MILDFIRKLFQRKVLTKRKNDAPFLPSDPLSSNTPSSAKTNQGEKPSASSQITCPAEQPTSNNAAAVTNDATQQSNQCHTNIFTNDHLELNLEQAAIYHSIQNRNKNFFVTGKAGTGKSVVLRAYVFNTEKNVAVVASTGIAAISIGGQTLHSFFGLETGFQDVSKTENIYKNLTEDRIRLLNSLDVVIVDEISMVRADVMDMIDQKLRAARKKRDLPFGGCQIIAFGDLYQLPPVMKDDKEIVQAKYSTELFFGAPVFLTSRITILELNQVQRQADGFFTTLLNKIREGRDTSMCVDSINQYASSSPLKVDTLSIVPTNKAAQAINNQRLEQISSPSYFFEATVEGDYKENEYPTDYRIEVKVGAQVIMLKNDPGKSWVNGTIARISDLSNDQILVQIKGTTHSIDKTTWTKYRYYLNPEDRTVQRKLVGSFTQYPLRLAYAITVHKSQGQTYDAITIDYSNGGAFAPGQTYVALSRCKSLENIFLPTKLKIEDIQVKQDVVAFMQDTFIYRDLHGTLQAPSSSFLPLSTPTLSDIHNSTTHITFELNSDDQYRSTQAPLAKSPVLKRLCCSTCGSGELLQHKKNSYYLCSYCGSVYKLNDESAQS